MKSTLPLVSALGIACVGGLVCAKKGTVQKIELASAKSDVDRAQGTPRPWAHDHSDISADENTVYGTLENGMRYIICKNALPPKRVSMRLHVDAGSLNEAEDQRGVAHFLEHMVFNGTKHFPDATKLIPQMQRLGIAFGAHANAYTAFDETVYMLDLPNIEKSTLDLGFAVMGDFADGALLSDEEIDEERGVIASEKTSRDSVSLRLFEQQFGSLLPNSLLKDRLPIGTDEVIANAPRERFVDFYTRFYTPEKMTFIYVGDLDVKEAEAKIRATFGQIKNPAKPGQKATLGDISTPKGLRTSITTDKELSTSEISLLRVLPANQSIDSKAKRLQSLKTGLADQIMARRFERLSKVENAKITSGSSSRYVLFRELELGSFEVSAVDNNWKEAISVLEQEFRKALQHGFTQSEFDEAVANRINSYEVAVRSAETRKSNDIASNLAKHAHKDAVYSTPSTDLAILKENLAQISPESVHQTFKEFWSTEDIQLALSTQSADAADETALKSIFLDSKKVEVSSPNTKAAQKFAYDQLGKAASVVAEKHIEDLDIHQLTLSNGIKVNFKKTDFDKDTILLSTSFGSGKAGLPLDKPGLESFASAMINAGGLGKHSTDELQSLMAGRDVDVSFDIASDHFSFIGKTSPEDLLLQLQLTTAFITDPGYRPEALRQYQAMLPSLYSQLKHTQQGAMAQMSSWLSGNDPRFTLATEEQALALTIEDAKAWLTPQFAQNQIEVSVVGDIELATLKEALCQTLGTLEKRTVQNKLPEAQRTLNSPSFPAEKTFNFESKIQKAVSAVTWKFADATDRDVSRMRRANILSSIFDDRLRVELRENLGIAYSPYAGASLSRTFKNDSRLIAISAGKPDDTEKVCKIIVGLGDKLAKEGASQDEVDRALKPALGILSKTLRQNSYWLNTVLHRSQEYPDSLDAARNRETDYKSITLEEINGLAKEYFTKENSAQISLTPSNK